MSDNPEHIKSSPSGMSEGPQRNLERDKASGGPVGSTTDMDVIGDPMAWLTLTNKEQRTQNDSLTNENGQLRKEIQNLQKQIRTLEFSVGQWRLNAQESTEHLRRVVANRDKPNYVDAFYNTKTKRLLQSLSEENLLLKSRLNNDQSVVKNISGQVEMKRQIQIVQEQLRIRTDENKRLQTQVTLLSDVADNEKPLGNNMTELNRQILQLSVENSTLRMNSKKHMEIMAYLKSHFFTLRREFFLLYGDHVNENGDAFLKQLKSLDGKEAPAFLSKSLSRSDSQSLPEPGPEPQPPAPIKRVQRDEDSGIGSLNEEQRELVCKSRELEETKADLSKCRVDNDRLKSDVQRHVEEATQLKQQLLREKGEKEVMRKERDDALNEAKSWRSAVSLASLNLGSQSKAWY